MLNAHWGAIKVRGAIPLYDICWVDVLLEAIRKAVFCDGSIVTFLTSMAGISILNLMPWSKADEDRYMIERGIRKKTAATRTYAKEKEMKKHAR